MVDTVGDALVKSIDATMRPARSGCGYTPLSTIATPTPWPVMPSCDQTCGALTSRIPGVRAFALSSTGSNCARIWRSLTT